MSEILELLEHQQIEQAAATGVQLLKAIHQAALDQGPWSLASTLLPWQDPLQREIFGGDAEEQASEETGGRQADKNTRAAAKAKAALAAAAGKGANGAG